MISFVIDPVIFRIGSLQITYYALVYLLGFLAGLWVLLKSSRRRELNINEEQVYGFMFFLILGLIVGARLFHVIFWNFDFYSENLAEIFYIWQGGFSFHGGLVGAALGAVLYSRKEKLNLLKIADILALPIIFFLGLGRLANFINQEIVGVMTSVSWCFEFRGKSGCRHPVQLYAAFGRFVLFGYLLWMSGLKRFRDGFIFWNFVFWIGLGRLFLDFIREGDKYFGLLVGQWFSLGMVLLGGYVLIKSYKYDLDSLMGGGKKSL